MFVDFVSERFQSRASIFAIELDAEIFIFSARVVAGCE
jgi:hypothetical protein